MGRLVSVHVAAFLIAGWAFGAEYTVTTISDTGVGSLRWAIGQANANAGPDTIRLKPELSGQWIIPRTPLPAITATTSILGDTNADGIPDLVVSGAQAGAADGLRVEADNCVVEGVAIANFAGNGIVLWYADGCIVRYCCVGVNAAGTKALPNGKHQIYLRRSHGNTIGRVTEGGRNIIAAGAANAMWAGIYLGGSRGNAIKNNYIGVARDGVTPLADAATSGVGITLVSLAGFVPSGEPTDSPRLLYEARENLIGGMRGDRNVIGGMKVGIDIVQAYENWVSANYVGVAGDGATAVPIQDYAVRIRGGSQGNDIAPDSAEHPERMNVFSSRSVGVGFQDALTQDNAVLGNRFGRNVAGTRSLPLGTGVLVSNGAGAQTVAENLFWGRNPSPTGIVQGVCLNTAGDGTRIESNAFRESVACAVYVRGVGGEVVGNTFRGNTTGVKCWDAPFSLKVWGNRFTDCGKAVHLTGESTADLGSVDQSQEGMNEFCPTNDWYIYNSTDNRISAEGNGFVGCLAIPFSCKGPRAGIWDHGDDPALGVVDISPHWSIEGFCADALALSGCTAAPTALGAEIAFTLSTPAAVSVSVLNLAGRPIATVCRARSCEAGANRLLWNACAESGVRVPGGRYLIQVRAQGPDGAQTSALTTVQIGR
jgi:hypothetical protein